MSNDNETSMDAVTARGEKASTASVQVYLPENASVVIRRRKGRLYLSYDDGESASAPQQMDGPVDGFPLIIPIALVGDGLLCAPLGRDALGHPIDDRDADA